MLDVSEDILKYIPDSISHDDIEARHSIIKSMDRNLNFMRASLLASVSPLVATDIPQITELDILQEEQVEKLTLHLLTALPRLNEKISHQLGLIINAQQSSRILIRQATSLVHPVDTSSVVTVEWKLRQPFQINVVRENEQSTDARSESQWLLRKLSRVEIDLLNEFNDRVQDAIQLVLESLALDI
ncbi:hypothetical protein G6F57_008903 [Rhizopus arrhizus]|uniref:Uncharacterized protein n=1 Tax=Rhizopus oryzae TaxID=64495 RepID=A0A9P6XG43_RHIOR|nr:hypothetical protein G6F23_002117 [Rhizopus arrhizus]KAG1414065.1 hypothetical protein G6F58_007148 [Rhizopus delemar]KAG0765061.1 hypothetical protein G6F24_004718 [Rhizopus arrhizus]KAG0785058.1 hypothetical protein G6F21_009502 [Rhizopus arrhizus]KAG0788864.1 hypothetical protein G6F22_006879 [Rhizopus arrhizus]